MTVQTIFLHILTVGAWTSGQVYLMVAAGGGNTGNRPAESVQICILLPSPLLAARAFWKGGK